MKIILYAISFLMTISLYSYLVQERDVVYNNCFEVNITRCDPSLTFPEPRNGILSNSNSGVMSANKSISYTSIDLDNNVFLFKNIKKISKLNLMYLFSPIQIKTIKGEMSEKESSEIRQKIHKLFQNNDDNSYVFDMADAGVQSFSIFLDGKNKTFYNMVGDKTGIWETISSIYNRLQNN